MASAPNVDGMVDIRSHAILQDVAFNQNECAHGGAAAAARGPFFRKFTKKFMPANQKRTNQNSGLTNIPPPILVPSTHPTPYFEEEDYDLKTPKQFDSHRSWVCCFCSVAIVFVIYGTLFSYAVLHRQIQLTYDLSSMQSIIIGAACFSFFVLSGPLAAHTIQSIGFRSTAIFGLLLVFFGLILEGFVSHVALFALSRLVLYPIGGSFAYTSSHYMSNFFAEKILTAVLVLCCSSVMGVIIYSWFSLMLQHNMDYRGLCIIFALIVLLVMTVTHAFPMKMKKLSINSTRNHHIKRCIEKNVRKEVLRKAGRRNVIGNPDSSAELKSCLCVCVFDVSAVCNRGFFLWATITMLATMTCTVPYLFAYVFYSRLVETEATEPVLRLVLAFCVPNLIGRAALVFYNNQTFFFNRTVFQIALTGTGVIVIVVSKLETYGWFAIWMMMMGLSQGLISVTIPRVTLQTVPREWLKRAWIFIIVLDGIGSFIGPVLMIVLRFNQYTVEFKLPCMIIGILQLIGTLFSFLLPNEEDNFKPDADVENQIEAGNQNLNPNSGNEVNGKGGGTTKALVPLPSRSTPTPKTTSGNPGEKPTPLIDNVKSYSEAGFSGGFQFGRRNSYTGYNYGNLINSGFIGGGQLSNYSCECPICSKLGPSHFNAC